MFGVSRMHLLRSLLSLLSPLQNVDDLVSENALLKEQIEIMDETAVCDPLFFIKECK